MMNASYTAKRLIQLAVLWVSTSFLPHVALGMEVNGAHKSDHIQVHVQDVRPYAYVDGVEAVGSIMDTLRRIEQRTHHTLNVILTPHKRILKDLNMQHVNLIVAFDGETFEGTEEVVPLFDFDIAVILRANKSFDLIRRDKNASIAVIRGTHMGVEAVNSHVKYIEVRTYDQALQLLSKNRVDAIMGIQSELGTAIALLDQNSKALIGATHIVDTVSAKIYVPNAFKAEPYVKEVKQAVEAMRREGALARPVLSSAVQLNP